MNFDMKEEPSTRPIQFKTAFIGFVPVQLFVLKELLTVAQLPKYIFGIEAFRVTLIN